MMMREMAAGIRCPRYQWRACYKCGEYAQYLCDFPEDGGLSTCDVDMCGDCAIKIGRNKHLCGLHKYAVSNTAVSP